MQLLLVFGLFALLTVVFYQDITQRAVYWLLFPILFLLSYMYVKNDLTIIDWGINAAFISMQLFALWLYFSWKEKRFFNYINTYLGWGDILFFLVLALWFTPVNFILFFIGSLVLTLVLVYALKITAFDKENSKSMTIPLAGIHALLLAIVMLLKECFFPDVLTQHWISI